jgi:hypothetical protein
MQASQNFGCPVKEVISPSLPLLTTLWRFLGTEWLSSTEKNDLLETLHEHIGSDPDLVGDVRVEAVELTAKITAAFEHQESGSYLDSQWISSLGADIFERGERVITIAHLGVHNNKDHWVTIDVDGPQRMLHYGDSLGNNIPSSLRKAYKWWASQHTPDTLKFSALPISTQTDSRSCGMFAANAADHAVDPTIPLMEQANIAVKRLQMLTKLAKHILDRVSEFTAVKFLQLRTGLDCI